MNKRIKVQTYVLQVTAVVLLVDELLDVLQRTAGASVEGHTGECLGGLVLVTLVLVHQRDALSGSILLDGEGSLLDGPLEARLVKALRVQWVRAEEVVHTTALQQVRRVVPGEQPVQVGGGVHDLDHFRFGLPGLEAVRAKQKNSKAERREKGFFSTFCTLICFSGDLSQRTKVTIGKSGRISWRNFNSGISLLWT